MPSIASLSQVLFITDKTPKNYDPHIDIRREMTSEIIDKMFRIIDPKIKHRTAHIELDGTLSKEQFKAETARALEELDERAKREGINRPTTVVYLGNDWSGRGGIYEAINEFGQSKNEKIRLAGSLGFTTGDCRVMSELSKEKIQEITETNKYFNNFFEEHPQGLFEITTEDVHGKKFKLNMDYDNEKAPFVSELGNFDGIHEHSPGNYKNILYVNIPGGEKYGTPYPFKKVNGEFSVEGKGIIFTIRDGLLFSVQVSEGVDLESLDASQKHLIERVLRSRLEGNPDYWFLPIAELGLGFYKSAGIKTYSDSSILTAEKSGPHIGFGHSVGESPEAEQIDNLSVDFDHADFVLDHPVIDLVDENGKRIQEFYHFIPNGI